MNQCDQCTATKPIVPDAFETAWLTGSPCGAGYLACPFISCVRVFRTLDRHSQAGVNCDVFKCPWHFPRDNNAMFWRLTWPVLDSLCMSLNCTSSTCSTRVTFVRLECLWFLCTSSALIFWTRRSTPLFFGSHMSHWRRLKRRSSLNRIPIQCKHIRPKLTQF